MGEVVTLLNQVLLEILQRPAPIEANNLVEGAVCRHYRLEMQATRQGTLVRGII